jgi:hypothetical protein
MNSTAHDFEQSPTTGALTVVSSGALGPVADGGDVESLERFQALEPGYYWTAMKDWKSDVAADDTLLLMDLTEFEGVVHSVTLRRHPRRSSGTFEMLVADFLDVFCPCLNADEIRQREQQEVMAAVTDIQDELMRTQSDTQLMLEATREAVEQGLKELERNNKQEAARAEQKNHTRNQNLGKVHRRAARRSSAAGNPLVAPKIALSSEVGGFISAGINEQGVTELRNHAARQAVVLTAQSNWLQSKTTEITEALKRLAPYLAEKSAVAIARTSGAMKMAKRIQRGIESLDLYTGKGVDVFNIRTGVEAKTSEPLTLIQGKRVAEEEMAVWADVDSGFDFRSKEAFFDAIASNDELMEQVLPFPRCVVSIQMTRQARNYGDAMANMLYNQENLLVFLLVRNGDNVHVVYSASPSHEGAPRLFPTMDDMERPFRGVDGDRISIRDVEFGESAKRFDEIALVYRRFLILLCGLDHRENLFGRFYPAEQQMRFMSAEFQANYFRFVSDEESGWLIGEELPNLQTWFATKNNMLQSGSRVYLLSFGVTKASPELLRRHSLGATPRQFESVFIAAKETNRLVTTLAAHDPRAEVQHIQVKCYLTGNENEAHSDAWWLCLDAVSLDEVRRYRHSRMYRSMGVSYLRLFRRVEQYLELEMAREAESRAYLLKAAVEFGGLSADVAASTLDTAVRNWRASRRGEPLPWADDTAALNDVLTLMVPEGHLPRAQEQMLTNYLAQTGHDPLLFTRSGKAKLMLYVTPTAEDKAAYPDVLTWGWVKRITLEPGKTKLKEGTTSLVWLGKALPASEVEVRRWEGMASWMNEAEEPYPLRKYAQLKTMLEGSKEWAPVLSAGPGAGVPEELFDRILNRMFAIQNRNRSRSTQSAFISIPIAAYSQDGRTLSVTYMSEHAVKVLWAHGTAEQREKLESGYLRRYHRYNGDAKIKSVFKWFMGTSVKVLDVRHDEPCTDVPVTEWGSAPDWTKHHIEVNNKPTRKEGVLNARAQRAAHGPYTSGATANHSPDRALLQLSGVAPTYLAKAFYAYRKKRIKDTSSWGFDAHDNRHQTQEQRDARRKATRDAIGKEQYKHKYRVALSPLVWRHDVLRPTANAVFIAPLFAHNVGRKKEHY